MNGYRISRTDSVPTTQRSSIAASLERMKRNADRFEAAFADVSPKPETVYNVRMKRTLPVFESVYRQLDAQITLRGAKLSEILAGGEGVLMDLESRHGDRSVRSLDVAHDLEFQIENEANPHQLRARITRKVEDIRIALEWTDKEMSALRGCRRELEALLAEKSLLEAHTQSAS